MTYSLAIHRDDPAYHLEHPATIYVREEAILPGLDSWIAELFTDEYLDDTCAALADAAQPDADEEARRQQIRQRIIEPISSARSQADRARTGLAPPRSVDDEPSGPSLEVPD